jgi:hypothetical protein
MQPIRLTELIDQICPPLRERIAQSRMPREMRVHQSVFDCIRSIRAREIANGYPLMFLGMELSVSDKLPADGFELID